MTRYSAVDIATALDQPVPTTEQQAVIESGPRPLLVVAGAGSGKTETMAARVVWLVANGLVEPDQVLGLTFTRKAAAELSQRIGQRLRALARTGLWTPPTDDGTGAEVLGGTPTVSTYHAYAGRLVREHALRVGIEPEFRLLTEAGAWQLAAEAVGRYDGPMDEVTKAESTVIDAVMSLAGEMAEHVRVPLEVIEHLDAVIGRLEALPDGEGRGALAGVASTLSVLRERRAVLPVVQRYLELKRERESLDFADQMAVAAGLARSVPEVGTIERSRFRAVLLDEFQDTSEAQLSLLHSLFHGGRDPVALTAVGDPNQSIYGWRGASATTLARFPDEFADGSGAATVLPLSTSWRNDALILEAANVTAAPLAAEHVRSAAPTTRRGPGDGRRGPARLDRRGGRAPRRLDRRGLALPERPAHVRVGRRPVPATLPLPPRHRRAARPRPARRGRRSRRVAHDARDRRPRRDALRRAGPLARRPADAAADRAGGAARRRRPRRTVGLGSRAARPALAPGSDPGPAGDHPHRRRRAGRADRRRR